MDTSALKELGFTENEISVYLELLKSEATASQLSRRTGINRTLAYQVLGRLFRIGLVSHTLQDDVKVFKAGHPSKLLAYLQDKELGVRNLLPELLALAPREKRTHSVELYEGKEGLKTLMNDILRLRPKEWLDITSGQTVDVLPDYFMDNWEKKRAKAGIHARFLVNSTEQGRKRGSQLSALKFSQVRYLPKGLYSPAHIYVYANKVGIALWEREFPFGVIIESREIASRFREFFEWFWRKS